MVTLPAVSALMSSASRIGTPEPMSEPSVLVTRASADLVEQLTEDRRLQHPPVPDAPAVLGGDPLLDADDGPDDDGDDHEHPHAGHDVRDVDQDLRGQRQLAAQAS